MTFNRPCLKCGALTKNTRGYCTPHLPVKVDTTERKAKKRYLYGGDYNAKAKLVRENSTHCYLCGKPFTEGEPIQADHLYPQLGSQSPLEGAHPHCNRTKSNKQPEQWDT
jgi:hypothetical protein